MVVAYASGSEIQRHATLPNPSILSRPLHCLPQSMRFLYARGEGSYTHFIGRALGYRREDGLGLVRRRDGRGCDVFESDCGVLSDEWADRVGPESFVGEERWMGCMPWRPFWPWGF